MSSKPEPSNAPVKSPVFEIWDKVDKKVLTRNSLDYREILKSDPERYCPIDQKPKPGRKPTADKDESSEEAA